MICKICNKEYKHLGSHIWHGHHIKAKEYKKTFGLDYNFPLISEEIKIKKQQAFEEDREKYLANITGEKSKKYQFKKGEQKRKYFSRQSDEKARQILVEINKTASGLCEICKMNYEHLQSHLFNKHGLIKVK